MIKTMKLGQRIAALRNKKGLTQEQMAEALGVKRARYNAWEQSISNPDIEMLDKLAVFHRVTVDFLLGRPHSEGLLTLTSDMYADGYTDESVYEQLENDLQKRATPEVPKTVSEGVIRELVEKYKIDLTDPHKKEMLEKMIRIVAED